MRDNSSRKTIRVLHVVGGMNRGGVETWLMHVLRYIDRNRFQIDFLVHTRQACAYDEEIRALGSRIIPCLHPSRPWEYAVNFKRVMREGPYDVIHSHVHHYSGYVLQLARQAGIPVRIAHSHNDTSSLQLEAGHLRRGYLALMQRWIKQYGTVGLAASRQAAAALFGSIWEADPRWRILYYGINLSPFQDDINPTTIRAELGVPPDAFVVGHVGRFVTQKNHTFLLEITAEISRQEPRTHLLLIGEGPLRAAIEQKAIEMGISNRVTFSGARSDVPRLMLGAMDVFLFPSLYEGLGLVLVEAQAAGLPCISSDVVPKEVDVVIPLMHRVSLAQPALAWAETVLSVRKSTSGIAQQDALALLNSSIFNIRTSVEQLESVYCA